MAECVVRDDRWRLLFSSEEAGDWFVALPEQAREPAAFVREVMAALRAHDPAAHRALVAEEARAAGWRVLTAEQAEWVLAEMPFLPNRTEDDIQAALRGDPQPEEVPPS